jgi:hypothetical protein
MIDREVAMFGIQDKFVWLAYVLCILSALLCVVYGLVNWNRGEEAPEPADVRWAAAQKKAEQDDL